MSAIVSKSQQLCGSLCLLISRELDQAIYFQKRTKKYMTQYIHSTHTHTHTNTSHKTTHLYCIDSKILIILIFSMLFFPVVFHFVKAASDQLNKFHNSLMDLTCNFKNINLAFFKNLNQSDACSSLKR